MDIEKVIRLIIEAIVALGTLGGILTAIIAANKTKVDVKIEEKRLDIDEEVKDVEITEKMRQISASLVENLRFELDLSRADTAAAREDIKTYRKNMNEVSGVLSTVCQIVHKATRQETSLEKQQLIDALKEIENIVDKIEDKYNL